MPPTPPPDPTPHEFVPWTPPGAPPPTRYSDALRPIGLIAVGAVVTAVLTAWLSSEPEPPHVALPPVPVADARAAVDPRPGADGPATLLVDSEPTGATVWMDGDSVGVTPLWLDAVEPGAVRLRVQDGRVSHDTTLQIAAAQDASIDVRLPVRLAPSQEPGGRPSEIHERSAEPAGIASAVPPPPLPRPQRAGDPAPRAAAQPARAPRVSRQTEARSPEPPPPASSQLQIASDPVGASVWIGGRKVGETPLSLGGLPPGEQVVELRAPGFVTERVRHDLEPGATVSQTVTMRLEANLVTVATNVVSDIYVDGSHRGDTGSGPLRLALAAGRHTVRVVHPEHGEETRTVNVVDGTTLRLIYRLALEEDAEGGATDIAETPRRGW